MLARAAKPLTAVGRRVSRARRESIRISHSRTSPRMRTRYDFESAIASTSDGGAVLRKYYIRFGMALGRVPRQSRSISRRGGIPVPCRAVAVHALHRSVAFCAMSSLLPVWRRKRNLQDAPTERITSETPFPSKSPTCSAADTCDQRRRSKPSANAQTSRKQRDFSSGLFAGRGVRRAKILVGGRASIARREWVTC
jgi:hypothetical protein